MKSRKRSLRKTRPKRKKGSLSITSLMDVLTIILIFLLVNYAESVQSIDVPSYVSLPTLQSKPSPNFVEDIKVAIGATKIQINATEFSYHNSGSDWEKVLVSTSQKLGQIHEQKLKLGKKSRISLKADQSISYKLIDEFLVSASSAGITNVDFVALTTEN